MDPDISQSQIPDATLSGQRTAYLDQASFQLFGSYPDKEKLLEQTHNAFLEGIEHLAGTPCRSACERDTMGFDEEFYVQDLLIVRIHYPHDAPRQNAEDAKRLSMRDQVRYGLAETWDQLSTMYKSGSIFKRPGEVLTYFRKRTEANAKLPMAYRCHAPHLDSWLGQPFDSLSVWLAITGVERDNSMCLYPETVGAHIPMGATRYLDRVFPLPKPTRPDLSDGDLFVFSTDILHSSVLNATDKTRIAFTTRIDPGNPIFDRDGLWFIDNWYSGKALLDGRREHRRIRGDENSLPRRQGKDWSLKSVSVEIAKVFEPGIATPVAPSDTLGDGEKIAVQFKNERIVILRNGSELRALSATCPHQGYRLDLGYHDRNVLTCPGHGLEFDAATGRSKLDCFALKRFEAYDSDGMIVLK